jgi:hypothetical protein
MLDTSVFGALNRKNSCKIVANDLEELRAAGDLVVTASTYQEIINTKDPVLKETQLRNRRFPDERANANDSPGAHRNIW